LACQGFVSKRHIGDEGDAKTHRTPKVIADYGRYRKVKLEIVLEVAFNSIQPSTRHATGRALRFSKNQGNPA
jgi:ATP-dependent DNA ligase